MYIYIYIYIYYRAHPGAHSHFLMLISDISRKSLVGVFRNFGVKIGTGPKSLAKFVLRAYFPARPREGGHTAGPGPGPLGIRPACWPGPLGSGQPVGLGQRVCLAQWDPASLWAWPMWIRPTCGRGTLGSVRSVDNIFCKQSIANCETDLLWNEGRLRNEINILCHWKVTGPR